MPTRRARPAAVAVTADALSPADGARDAWLALDRQLCFALYATSLAMTKRYKPLLEPLGLTYPQYLAMLVLWECAGQGDGVYVSTLGQRLSLDSGTLTPLLKRLESLGYVERERDAADERRVRLRLTAAGTALKRQAHRIPQAIVDSSGCTLGELAELTTRLQSLRERLVSGPTAAVPDTSGGDPPEPPDSPAPSAAPARSPRRAR